MYFLLILSHKNSIFRDNQRKHILSTNNSKFIFYYFIGDMSLKSDYLVDEPNNIVYLKVPDNYESLSLKTYYAMKFISENYPKIAGVFKTDDDIDLDIDKMFKCIGDNSEVPYFGSSVESKAYESSYHFGKCESPEMNKKNIHIPECSYCAGGGYYISATLIDNLLNNKEVFQNIIFEDVCVGISMNKCGVFPTYVNIKENGCMWGSPDIRPNTTHLFNFDVNNKSNIDVCVCGQLKNRREFNFCQRCNKMY